MGQKVNPVGLRLGVNRTWDSRWYADDDTGPGRVNGRARLLRGPLDDDFRDAGLGQALLEELADLKVFVQQSGVVVIGKKGADIEKLRGVLSRMTSSEVHLNIVEVRKPEVEAQLVAENVSQQLERRVSIRRAMKRAVQSAMRMGAEGIRINCAGRLGGAEIARIQWYREGRVPLHTLRANVDYGESTAFTTYGTTGVKVWIYKGEIMEHDPMALDKLAQEQQPAR